MDKSVIKNYAVNARRKLITAVSGKANQLYIFEDSDKTLRPGNETEILQAGGIFLSSEQMSARGRLIDELSREATAYKPDVFHRKMEEIAYTWFNRLIALRFMEVNDYLPSGIRILSSKDKGRSEPDALREVDILQYVDKTKVVEFRADTAFNAPEKLYRYILVTQCNALSNILPGMFEKVSDYTELLFPDNLYTPGGIIHDLINTIAEENFSLQHQGQIEIIGWLYQYYISEKKEEVFAALKKNVKINKDTIPAATQLFTPEWIVKYMVENSLGRLWLESNPNDELRKTWKYYVDEAEQEPEVAEQLRILRSENPIKEPQDIKLIDPCMGSGHILVYAFDVLYQIYESVGYSEREIPNLILQHNIYGLDIDDRAGQLAYFALMMKARGYNRRFFRQDNVPQPMVFAVPETKLSVVGLEKWLGVGMDENDRAVCFEDMKYLAELFSKGKEYGSAMKIEREIDFARLRKYVNTIKGEQITLDEVVSLVQMVGFERVIDVAEILAKKYDVVVTNPPYMGNGGMSGSLIEYVKIAYPDSKSDMSTIFMEKALDLCNHRGYMSMINIPVWMFLSSYENLRVKLLNNNTIINMLHFGRGVFGSDFGTTSFVYSKTGIYEYEAVYRKLYKKQGAVDSLDQKEKWFFEKMGAYTFLQKNFFGIPGNPIAYWATKPFLVAYKDGVLLEKVAPPKQGSTTGNNDLFLRFWYEVNKNSKKWYPCLKGGAFRKWYGNHEYVIDWENNGENIKKEGRETIRNLNFLFKKGISWSRITISQPSFRIMNEGYFFESASGVCFPQKHYEYVLGLLNSKIVRSIAEMLNPTATLQSGDLGRIPVLEKDDHVKKVVKDVSQIIELSKTDWDNFETSCDFERHPLLKFAYKSPQKLIWDVVMLGSHSNNTLSDAFRNWMHFTNEQFNKLKSNEEELNRIFIEIYGLQGELTPEVEDKDVTIRKADLGRDIRSFVSYAVGCMFGRYSLDELGLAFAGGDFDISLYKLFKPSEDNVIPIGTADYFENDIVLRFVDFVRMTFGENTLGENLDYIANALYPNGSGTAQERIRRYFLNDFYKDHLKIYQKRPIYWMFDSGKKNGFKALFYLHRYDKYTVARARTDYLHPLQRKYDAEIKRLELLASESEDNKEKGISRKEIGILQNQIDECRIYDQVLAHIAHQQIELDLDDGVKVNYAKFQGVEVPKDDGKIEKMDLLGKI